MYDQFYISKITDTDADLFLLYGFCALISHLLPDDSGYEIAMEDKGSLFHVTLNRPLPLEAVEGHMLFALNPFLQTSSRTAPTPPDGFPHNAIIHYDDQKRINDEYWAALRNLPRENRRPDRARQALEEQGIPLPDPRYPIWALINQQKAVKAYAKVITTWHEHQKEAFGYLLKTLLDCFASPMNDLETLQSDWQALAREYQLESGATETAPQIINPGMGKGSSYSKATRVSEGNLENFWLLEYLRYAGLYTAGIALSVQGGSDRKNYIPVPYNTKWETFKNVFQEYRQIMLASTAVKLDILAVLRYVTAHLDWWKRAQARGFKRASANPHNHIRAISAVSLKDMGSSHAVMRMNEINVPRWVQNVETSEDADHYLEIITEHRRIVEGLDEAHSDEYALLRAYRHYLTSDDLAAFLEFTRGYAHVILSRMNERKPVTQFSVHYLEEVLMTQYGKKLTPILENPGFRAIAEAIRRSTVIPQYQKSQGRESIYDIRYGLGDNLVRVAPEKQRFVTELTNFMHLYNRETARLAETRRMQFRKAITVEDIEMLIELIDEYQDTELIAGMLVAYGYARDPELGKSREESDTLAEV